MNSDSQRSGPAWAGTSSKKPVSECAFLAQHAAEARLAMARSAGDLARNAAVALSPSQWIKEHPFATLGVPALGVGSIAAMLGMMFLGRKKQQAGGLFSRLFHRAAPAPVTPAKRKPWWLLIIEQVFTLAQPALFSAVATILGSRFVHHPHGHDSDNAPVR